MKNYICHSPSKEQFDVSGNSMGPGGDRALYYSPKVGKHRFYRSSYPIEKESGLVLYIYKSQAKCKHICDSINLSLGEDFKPLELSELVTA